MINWLKYFPLEFRNDHSLHNRRSPKGPDFSKSKKYTFNIGGNSISFKCPLHSPYKSYVKPYTAPNQKDLLTLKFNELNRDSMPDDSWLTQLICKRDWVYYGPWFTGPQCELSFSVSIITKRKRSENENFLHPKAFENAIASYLTSLYAHDTYNDVHRWVTPVNWKSITNLNIFASRFDTLPSTTNEEGQKKHTLCFPVTDKHILIAEFTPHIYSYNKKITYEELLKLIDTKPMDDLIESVATSFNIKPSKEKSSINYNSIEENRENLTATFSPLKWDRKNQEDTSPLLDITS